jgi:pimeloyl-ACP methyl ester carboxylesterase
MKHPGKTPPFRGPHGESLPGSIAEITYLRLGGLEQWVMIRGERITNPALIVLHGGPGMSETSFFRRCNAALEKSFTDVVRKRIGQGQVVILGHSWGSVLGALYAARFPEKVALYIGCAQIGDAAAGEAGSYAYALAAAQRLDNRKALKELRAMGPPPHSASDLFKERTWVSRFDGQFSPRAVWKMARLVLGTPESSIVDLPNLMRGFRFSIDAMWAEVSRLNLLTLVPALQMPVFFFLGRRDHWVPPETSVAYIDALRAPSKTLVWFEESGHEMFVDEPAKFNATVTEMVRPALRAAA